MDYLYDGDSDLYLEDVTELDTSESQSSDSGSSSPISEICSRATLKKRRRSSKKSTGDVNTLVRPRMIATDIRRSYIPMFINVINSDDFPLMFGFFETFFAPDVQSVVMRPEQCRHFDKMILDRQYGFYDITRYWWSMFHSKPDSVMSMEDCDIVRPFGSEESVVVSSLSIRCTNIRDDFPRDFCCPNTGIKRFDSQSAAGNVQDVTIAKKRGNPDVLRQVMMQEITRTADQYIANLPLLPDPFHGTGSCIFGFHLNASKQISKIEMYCKSGEIVLF